MKRLIFKLIAPLYKLVQRTYMLMYCHKPKYDKKYNVAICGIFKNEARFLKEWINYHTIVGVEHFYLYNNNSTDNYQEVLQEFIDSGIVTLIDWPHNQAQVEAYKDFYTRYRNETQWVSLLDMDEFIVPKRDKTVLEWLKKHDKNPVNLIYWKMYNSSGKLEHDWNKLVTEQYTVAWDGIYQCGKCIINTDYNISKWDASVFHSTMTDSRICNKFRLYPIDIFNNIPMSIKPGYVIENKKESEWDMQINHYHSKAWSEYSQKRKFTGDVFFQENPKAKIGYFLAHEYHKSSFDASIFRFLLPLKWKMNGMKEYQEFEEDRRNK